MLHCSYYFLLLLLEEFIEIAICVTRMQSGLLLVVSRERQLLARSEAENVMRTSVSAHLINVVKPFLK